MYDMAFFICLYDDFVHYYMFKLFKRESYNPGSIQVTSEINSQYKNRKWVNFSQLFPFYYYTYVTLCKDLDWDILELFLVQVDKENLMEFSFDYSTLLIHLLCLLLFINSCASLLVVPSRMSTNFLIKRNENENENENE